MGSVMVSMKRTHLVVAGLAILSPLATAADQPEQQAQSGNLTYVGSKGRVGIGYDTKNKFRGEAYWVLSEDDLAAWIGEGWGSRSAGGLKLNYQWVPGGELKKTDSQSVRKLFAAVDQNDQRDQKLTVGGGMERENLFWGAYVSAALSGSRTISDSTATVSETVFGAEQDGRQYSQDTLTTTHSRIYERPYDFGIGAHVGRYFNEPLIRLSGGLDYEWGRSSNHQTTLSLKMEKFIANTPHSFSVNAEVLQKAGELEQKLNDQRLFFMYRYEFGGKNYRPERESRLVERSVAAPVDTQPDEAVTIQTETEARPAVSKPRFEKRMVKTSAAMLSDAFFKFDSATLTPEAKTALDSVIATLRKAGYSGNIHLVGHTCDIGTDQYNQKLSERRALSIKKYLVENGGIPVDVVITEGKGESNPRYPNEKATRYKNRRVDLEFVTFAEKLEDIELPPEVVTPVAAKPAKSEKQVKPAKPAQIEWVSEYIDTEPAWLRRALHNTTPHKQSVDVYRQQEREVSISSGDKNYINRAPSAQGDAFSVNSGETALFDVLANDSDPDQDVLTITSVTLPANGVARVSGNRVSYTSALGFAGSDSFSYTATDSKGATSTAQVTVTVNAVNHPPVAVDDVYVVSPYFNSVHNVVQNDSDPDGDALTIVSFTQPHTGRITQLGSDKLVFTPQATFTRTSFSYTISDGKGGTSSATVTLIDP